MHYESFSEIQARNAIDLRQTFDAWRSASAQYRAHYLGGMVWKSVHGKQYLIKTVNRSGGQKSLGPRSPATEDILSEFTAGKARLRERVNILSRRIQEMSSIARAVHINRVPNVVTRILRKLDEHHLLGKNLMVVGTNAIFAYEAGAACFVDPVLTATTDCDLMWDARSRLKLAAGDVQEYGLMSLLQSVDKSFMPLRTDGYRCANNDGFLVDLIKPAPNPPWKPESAKITGKDALTAAEIPSLKWLLSSPKFEATVIGLDGSPALMVAPDPRAFAIHKLWLSRQPDRDPAKVSRDRGQAFALASIIRDKLPHLQFSDVSNQIFPAALHPVIAELIASAERGDGDGPDQSFAQI